MKTYQNRQVSSMKLREGFGNYHLTVKLSLTPVIDLCNVGAESWSLW